MTEQPLGAVIAVVDDDRRILESLAILLESADYETRSFTSAKAFLGSGCLAEIDCLITDIDMPEMDGIELSRAVHGARPWLPIIIITGHPNLLDELPSADFRVFRLFKKPFDGQELLNVTGEAVMNRPS